MDVLIDRAAVCILNAFSRCVTFRSGGFGLSCFSHRTYWSWSFRSQDISVRLWNLAEILYVHFLIQTYLNQRKVSLKTTTSMIQDPTVNH